MADVTAHGRYYGNFSEDDKQRAMAIFAEYDADNSGTMNSFQEAQDISLNTLLGFTTPGTDMCKVPGMASCNKHEAMERIVHGLGHVSEQDTLSFEQYWDWFAPAFSDIVDNQGLSLEQLIREHEIMEKIALKEVADIQMSYGDRDPNSNLSTGKPSDDLSSL